MVDKYGTGQDPYCYPGLNTLINLLDIREEGVLENAERELTEIAIQKLDFAEPPYDYLYFKSIHKTLFSDIYEWAGEERTVDLSRQDTRFCTVNRIEPEANKSFSGLKNKNYFVGLSGSDLIVQVAMFYSDLNVLHPFRDGNGRVQRILFEHIILNCGCTLTWEPISREEWLAANVDGYYGNYDKLIAIFERCIEFELQP